MQTENSFDLVKGTINGNEVHIESNNSDSNVFVSWMVVAERNDDTYNGAYSHDESDKFITEADKPHNDSVDAMASLKKHDEGEYKSE